MQWRKFLASCLMVALATVGCAGQDDYVVVHRSADALPEAPESTIERIRQCVEDTASQLDSQTYVFSFEMHVSNQGHVLDAKPTATEFHTSDLQRCMAAALKTMTVPARVLAKALAQSADSKRYVGNPLAAAAGAVALAPIAATAAGVTAMVYVTAVVLDQVTTATMDAFDEHREKMRCKKVLEKCIAKCSEETLPTGDLGGDAFHKCRKECLDAENCWGVRTR